MQEAKPFFPAFLSAVSEQQRTVGYYNLTLPRTDGAWLGTFGRPPFPGPRQNASLGFLDYMQAGASQLLPYARLHPTATVSSQ